MYSNVIWCLAWSVTFLCPHRQLCWVFWSCSELSLPGHHTYFTPMTPYNIKQNNRKCKALWSVVQIRNYTLCCIVFLQNKRWNLKREAAGSESEAHTSLFVWCKAPQMMQFTVHYSQIISKIGDSCYLFQHGRLESIKKNLHLVVL